MVVVDNAVSRIEDTSIVFYTGAQGSGISRDSVNTVIIVAIMWGLR